MDKKQLKQLGEQKAQDAIDFLKLLKHTKGQFHGAHFNPLDWQEKIIRDVYGTLKPDGYRQYKNVYLEIPKKQGKSELLAGLGLKQLCADGEWQAEVYGCAAEKDQAGIIFDVAVEMVDQEPTLKRVIKPILSKKRLVYLPTKSFYQVLSSEAYSKHGLNVSTCLFDEVHAQQNRDLYNVMTFGSGDARAQPLYFFITTAGEDPDRVSIGWELHERATAILTGERIDPSFYAAIWGIDEENKRIWRGWDYITVEEIDWKDKKLWKMVNPSINKTVKMDKLDEAFTTVNGNQKDEKLFRQLRLNIWNKFKTTKWVPHDMWIQNGGIIDLKRLKKRECYGGLDLSSKLDISAYVNTFPPEDKNDKYIVLPIFWIPEDNVEKMIKEYKMPFDQWIRNGLLKTTKGNRIDYNFIVKDILVQADMFDIQEIGYDPWNADSVATDLDNEGLQMVEVRQNFKNMSPPMKEMEAFLLGKHINHGNNPILNWMFGNLNVITNENGDIRPIKGTKRANFKGKTGSEMAKIDGIVAMINSFHRVIANTDNDDSAYKERGVLGL